MLDASEGHGEEGSVANAGGPHERLEDGWMGVRMNERTIQSMRRRSRFDKA
jgi:hypothetical protein